MRSMTINEIKEIEFSLLKYVKNICNENDLKYTLAYGTLLGAVRHKGFIPWDDDIDVAMLFDDYLKLMEILRHDKTYRLINDMYESKYIFSFSKLMDRNSIVSETYSFTDYLKLGVFIDIFPVFGVPADANHDEFIKEYARKEQDVFMSNYKYYSWCSPDMGFCRHLAKCIRHFPGFLRRKLLGTMHWKNERRKFQGIMPVSYADYLAVNIVGINCIIPASWFKEYTELEFEGEKFTAIKDYDKWLRLIYGDYMQLPPLDKRVPDHFRWAYCAEK